MSSLFDHVIICYMGASLGTKSEKTDKLSTSESREILHAAVITLVLNNQIKTADANCHEIRQRSDILYSLIVNATGVRFPTHAGLKVLGIYLYD